MAKIYKKLKTIRGKGGIINFFLEKKSNECETICDIFASINKKGEITWYPEGRDLEAIRISEKEKQVFQDIVNNF